MSAVAVCLVLGALLVLLLRTRALRVGGAAVAVLFGFVLATTPASPVVGGLLDQAGRAMWSALQGL